MDQHRPTTRHSTASSAGLSGSAPPARPPRAATLARRHWVFRSTATLAMAAVALCFFVAWHRDGVVIHDRLELLSGVVKVLQSQVDSLGTLPAEPPESTRLELQSYVNDADRYYASHTTDPVIVAATDPVQMLFKSDGLAIILYHKGKVSATWMTTREYENARLEQENRIVEFERDRKEQPIVLP